MIDTELQPACRGALVTGAARRIGLRIAERLAEAGYGVVLHCSPRSQPDAQAAVARIVARGHAAYALPGDLGDPSALETLIEKSRGLAGPLALLVNNASVFEPDAASGFGLDVWNAHFAVNLRAAAVLSRDFAAQIAPGAAASIVNIIDQRVLRPTPQFFSYSLSKAALWAATRTMAQAFASRGIRVNAVGPGPVLPNAGQGEAGFAKEVAGLPLQHPVTPDEIAAAVLYLSGAGSVTGQMIAVDAGQHLAWETPDIVL